MKAGGAKRFDVIDVARGCALVAMAAYHFTWDLAYFGVISANTPFTTPMRVASHAIGSLFLALAGVSLALAHEKGFHWRAFSKRLARIGAAAALVTAATYAIAPETVIGFGILHCIFVASLLAPPFLIGSPSPPSRGEGRGEGRLSLVDAQASLMPPHPNPLPGGERDTAAVDHSSVDRFQSRAYFAVAVGLALIIAPWLFASPLFNPPWFIWLGLGTQEPPTLDWRPLLPWGGVLLIGVGAAMLAPVPFSGWRANCSGLRAIAFAGRHSLAVYLIHQPILLGLLYGVTEISGFNQRQSVEAYLRACRPACVEAGGGIETCEHACACVVRDASTAGLAERLGAHSITKDERRRLSAIVETCGSEAK
jgi:uncharacterized membrane protein